MRSALPGAEDNRAFDAAFFEAGADAEEQDREVADRLELEPSTLSDPEKRAATAYGALAGGRRTAARWTFDIGIDG